MKSGITYSGFFPSSQNDQRATWWLHTFW